MPDLGDVECTVSELARTLKAPTLPHMAWCLKKLSALPTRQADKLEWAFWAENFFDTSSDIPDDIWSSAVTELLRVKTFRPSPAEFEAIARPEFLHRQRRLERAQTMMASIKTNHHMEPKPAPKPIDPKDRLRDTIRRGRDDPGTFLNGLLMKVARSAERELAILEAREPEAWVHDAEAPAVTSTADQTTYTARPMSPENDAMLKRAIARKHRAQGNTELAAKMFNEAQRIYPLDDLGRPMLTMDNFPTELE